MGFGIKDFFARVAGINASELDDWRTGKKEGEYQLLDVRQPGEYEKGHIAGAILIPLAELPSRFPELSPDIPLLVYCAVGGRSQAAARFLAGQGFSAVINLRGGIRAYDGGRVKGSWEEGINLFADIADSADVIGIALAMEVGLREVYRTLAAEAAPQSRGLLSRLAGMEEAHIARLSSLNKEKGDDATEDSSEDMGIIEGGGDLAGQLRLMRPMLDSPADIIDLAMGIELQAFDLYARMATVAGERFALIFKQLSRDERAHLEILARIRDGLDPLSG